MMKTSLCRNFILFFNILSFGKALVVEKGFVIKVTVQTIKV